MYDALGRRLAKDVVDHRAAADPTKTFTRRYVYNGGEVLLEYSGANQLLASYTQSGLSADSQLSARVTAAGVTAALAPTAQSYQFIKDAQGTVVDITDNSGSLVQHYIYSVFGVIIGIQDGNAADVTANPPVRTSFTYTGREFDSESGFYYHRARYYDPYSGRFLQKDPEPGRLDLPSTMINGYVYAGSNPANNSDPSGRAWWQLAAVIAITVIVTVVAAILTGPGAGPIAYAVAGILSGAIIGASAAAVYGGNVGEGAARGAIMGAITGAAAGVGSAIGAAANAANAAGAVVTSVVAGALIGAVGFGIAGYDPVQGAIMGAIAGGVAGYRSASPANAAPAESESKTDLTICGTFPISVQPPLLALWWAINTVLFYDTGIVNTSPATSACSGHKAGTFGYAFLESDQSKTGTDDLHKAEEKQLMITSNVSTKETKIRERDARRDT